jgi:hypothetical protein
MNSKILRSSVSSFLRRRYKCDLIFNVIIIDKKNVMNTICKEDEDSKIPNTDSNLIDLLESDPIKYFKLLADNKNIQIKVEYEDEEKTDNQIKYLLVFTSCLSIILGGIVFIC